jgi:hypothetical protein
MAGIFVSRPQPFSECSDCGILKLNFITGYADHMTIGGIIYLQDISQPRLHPSSQRNVEIFRNLCGSEALSSVIITTGKWDLLGDDVKVGVKRETQLKEALWTEVISAGGSVSRFEGTQESAWKIINAILHNVENTNHASCLQIQKELVDLLRCIPETDAGRTLKKKIASLQTIQRERVEEDGADDSECTKLKNINSELAALKIPLTKRLKIFFGLAVCFFLSVHHVFTHSSCTSVTI